MNCPRCHTRIEKESDPCWWCGRKLCRACGRIGHCGHDRSIRAYLKRLPAGPAYVLEKRLGLDGRPRDTLNVIAHQLNVSKERVRQMENAARARLRRERNLQKYKKRGSRRERLKVRVDQLPFSARGQKIFQREGIVTVAGLLEKSERDLRRLRGLGTASLRPVKALLRALGFRLKKRPAAAGPTRAVPGGERPAEPLGCEGGKEGPRRDPRIREVLARIGQQYADPVRVRALARAVDLSPSYLQHLFKAAVGQPLKSYLKMIRLEKAAQLLRQSAENVSEIAYRVGYSDASHFSRDFKERFGAEPRAYRGKR